MLTKMRDSKGFTLVELMIVVAILGILAAVAGSFYQRYIHKARVASLVLPCVHSVQTNIATFYAANLRFPSASSLTYFLKDADSTRVIISVTGGSIDSVTFEIDSPATTSPLYNLDGLTLIATAAPSNNNTISAWTLSGSLVTEIGMR